MKKPLICLLTSAKEQCISLIESDDIQFIYDGDKNL